MDDEDAQSPNASGKRPRGRDSARAALIDAAATLFAEQGDVSVRAIAAKAEVNHGLVHHYFGGKEGLRGAVLDHLSAEQARAIGSIDLDDPAALARAALSVAQQDQRFFRVLARALLDGNIPRPMQSAFPVVQRLVQTMKDHGVKDAQTRVAEGIAISFGWMLFGPWIEAAVGVSTDEAKQLADQAIDDHVRTLLGDVPPEDQQ